nr:unnamed protein product [Digitaria exilis]
MGVAGHNDPILGERTCESLLQQLQLIWDEVGESDEDRDKMLLQIEQECFDVYRRNVNQASSSRARLLEQLAHSKSELTRLLSSLGELSIAGIIQALASQLSDLWNLMDAPMEERQPFHHITCNLSLTLDEVTVPGALALDVIEQAQLEVERLDQLKASRMKDIAFKKQIELEDIYARAHIAIDSSAARDRIMSIIESSSFEPSELLADMENRILEANEEALSRKDILERVDRWMSACEEESWLEDYSRDDNRYSATRGAHLNLKRAEKARGLVNKIPAIVDTLTTKTRAWEQEHGWPFTYDGVHLLAMLDEYKNLRQEKEEERRRLRDQKKINDQLAAQQENLFGSKPSPARPQSSRKVAGARTNGGTVNGTPVRRLSALQSGGRTANRDGRRDVSRPVAPVNYVAIAKEDAASQASSNHTGFSTP